MEVVVENQAASPWVGDPLGLAELRLDRLRQVMRSQGVPALLTADPINIVYATGVRNMTVFSQMGAVRFVLVLADGPVVLWEFGGSEHLAKAAGAVDEVRTAPGITALAGHLHGTAIDDFATEVAWLVTPSGRKLAVERFDHPVTDALRAAGLDLVSATGVFLTSRMVKLPEEIEVIRHAVQAVEGSVSTMRPHLAPGATEVEVWSHFHQALIAADGEYVSTRLVQSGSRTFPYFQEAGTHELADGDLFCIDTDAIGVGGYGVDLSRTYLCGTTEPTDEQRHLHGLAAEQLEHNAALLAGGVVFDDFIARSWPVPERFSRHGYYCLAHGLGMSGEYPYIPSPARGAVEPYPGSFEAGMIVCVESYVGDEESGQGVKLEDQYLIVEGGAERLTTIPFDERLSR